MRYLISFRGSFTVEAATVDEAVEEAKKYPDLFARCAYLMEAHLAAGQRPNDEYLLVGHKMFVGDDTFYYRGTERGVGGTKKVSEATRFGLDGARMNQIPPYDQKTGRGWEIVRFMEARDLR